MNEIYSDEVLRGRSRDLASDRYVRCARCGFPVKWDRDRRGRDGSKEGWGSIHPETTLNGAVAASATAITLTSVTGFATPGTGSITAFATSHSGKRTKVTSASHGLKGGPVVITGTTNYNGEFSGLDDILTDSFVINTSFVADDATGTWTKPEYIYIFTNTPVYDGVLVAGFNGGNGDTTYTAETGQVFTFGAAGIELDTSEKRFGASSLKSSLVATSRVDTPHTTDYDFAGDFTISLWVNFYAFGVGVNSLIIGNSDETANKLGWYLFKGGDLTNWYFTAAVTKGVWDLTLTSTVPPMIANRWYHIAVVRSGSTVSFYMDGKKINYATYATAISSNATNLHLAGDPITLISSATWIDSVQIFQKAVWTSDFIVPTKFSPWVETVLGQNKVRYTGISSLTLTGCTGVTAHSDGDTVMGEKTENGCPQCGTLMYHQGG